MIRYLITDPAYYTNNPLEFALVFERSLRTHAPTHACFRDKISDNPSVCYEPFLDLCQKYTLISFLNGSVHEAKKWGFEGVHIRSHEYHLITEAVSEDLRVCASCHTWEDVQQVIFLGATMATLSPVWESPEKGPPLGLERLNEICDKIELPIIALGGVMTQTQIDAVASNGAAGFASIRYFLTMDKV